MQSLGIDQEGLALSLANDNCISILAFIMEFLDNSLKAKSNNISIINNDNIFNIRDNGSGFNKNKRFDEKHIWDVLKTCYDREIPVNIVDLGLIYNMEYKQENDDLYFILGVAQNINLETIDLHIPNWINIEKNNPQKALECADFAIVASGTSTIEATVYETPMIIIYKMSYLSWLLSKFLIKVNYVGMVNIIANSMIMP